ncbi:hypothetical protein FSARC_3818 [Fusarium sarcochroum]|uniref:Alpha/beta hydrolase fold-3 domain-containing protein n=1 Tax=Fusarium sarcochroum TaxID=1208366 RepID=A0A8H4XBF2_9HYPO|nr:hypothetical protein FSARC_3818 [Fusarium sarcochroum]
MGDASDEESNARVFAKELGAVCLVPEYRLAPEYPFPMGILDCWDVLKWAAANAGEIYADPARSFIVGGSSAGANMAAVLVHQARKEEMSPRLTGQWLSAAYLLPPELVPKEYKHMYTSMWENTIDPVLPPLLEGPDASTRGFIIDMVRADVTSPLFSPFSREWYNATAIEQAPIPKAFFQAPGLDPLRDHALIYQQVLESMWGTKTKLVHYEGFGHMYWANWPQLQRSQDYWRDMVSGPEVSRWTDIVLKYHWLKGTRAQYVHALHQRYGPVVRVGTEEVDICDIAAAKEIHGIKDAYKKAPFYEILIPGTTNLFNATDVDFHRRHRRLLSSPLSESSLKTVEPTVDLYVKKAITSMRREMEARGTVDVAKFWLFMTTDIIVELSFGESFGILENGEVINEVHLHYVYRSLQTQKSQYVEDLENLASRGAIRTTFPTLISLATKLPLPMFKETTAAAMRLRTYSEQAVARYKRDFASNPAAAKPMLFKKLFEAGEAELSDEEIRAEAQAYIVAGSDTTATTLTYLVFCVCRHTDAKKTLVKELQRLAEDFGHADLRDLPYLNNVIDETLRLYSAAPGALPRVVPPGGASLAGHFLAEKTVVSTQAWTLHRNPAVFPNPEKWDSSRWEQGTKEMHDTIMPFGGGSRVCIGKHLARMELRLATARFFRAFPNSTISSLEGMSKDDMEPQAYFLLAPKGGCCLIKID